MKPVLIPRRVDEPPNFFLWSVDEAGLIAVFVMLGVLFDQSLIFSILGLFLARLYRRLQDAKPNGYLAVLLWRAGLVPSKSASMREPYSKWWIF